MCARLGDLTALTQTRESAPAYSEPTPPRRGRMNALLTAQVLDGPVPVVLYLAALALAVYLLIRRPGRGRLLASAIGILAGTVAAIVVFVVSNLTNAFGEQLQI